MSEKKGKKEKKDKKADVEMEITADNPPPSFVIGRQLDKEKIDQLTKRLQNLVLNNQGLRTSADKNEKDTHDIVLYFQREMEMKDDIISRLNEELVKKESLLYTESERIKKEYEEVLSTVKRESGSTIDDLKVALAAAENELTRVENYRRDKDYYDKKLANLEKSSQEEKQQSFDALAEQERKFLENKSHILKDFEDQKDAFRAAAIKEARQTVDGESKRLVVENKRLSEELKFHNVISSEMHAEKVAIESKLTIVKRDLALLTEKESEYARQGVLKNKEIKMLRDRLEQLEMAQISTVEKFKARTKEMKNSIQKELEESSLDATGLRRLIKIKNQELRHMKALAATILNQRSEMEQFFLEALNEVTGIIKDERRKKHSGATKPTKIFKNSGTFPNIKSKNPLLSKTPEEDDRVSLLPTKEDEKVFIRDLSWEDKELVLRILFAKMNGLHKNVENVMMQAKKVTSKAKSNSAFFVSEGKGIVPIDENEDEDGEEEDDEFNIPNFEAYDNNAFAEDDDIADQV